MEFVIIAIKDALTERFMQPLFFENEEVAKRWFKGVMKNNEAMKDNATDYELFEIGKFNDKEGVITVKPKRIKGGKEVINER